MNMQSRWLPVVLAGLIACSGNGGTDEDVNASDAIDLDAPDAVDNRICLGALPTSEFKDLAVSPGGVAECTHSPGITGAPVAIPAGGWLIQTHPSIGCTDMDATRLTWLKPDGSTVVMLEDEVFTMAQKRTLPALFAVLESSFVLYDVGCSDWQCYDGVWPGNIPKLTARDWDNNELWTLSAADLGGANGAKLIDVDEYGLWVALTTVTEDRVATSHLARIGGSDGNISIFDLPISGTPESAVAFDDGILILVDNKQMVGEWEFIRTLTAIPMATDGTAGSATEVFRWEDTNVLPANVTFKVTPFETGVLAGMDVVSSEDDAPISYRGAFVNKDGRIRWQHSHELADKAAMRITSTRERADGGLECVTYSPDSYTLISPDGQSAESMALPADNPLGDGREWYMGDVHFLDDGVLIMAGIMNDRDGYDQDGYDAVVAMYEPGFAALRWARQYGESCSDTPLLARSGDGWMIYCPHDVEWPEGESAYGPLADQAGTYLYFDAICD